MSVITKPPGATSAAELMDQLNTETGKLNAWIRTQANSPAQRPWFTDAGGATGSGDLAKGRVAGNQINTEAHRVRRREIRPSLFRNAEIARSAEVTPLETTNRQGILLTNPGLGGRTSALRAISAMRNR